MILTVTLNAALDITHHVDALHPHSEHRVRDVTARAGGRARCCRATPGTRRGAGRPGDARHCCLSEADSIARLCRVAAQSVRSGCLDGVALLTVIERGASMSGAADRATGPPDTNAARQPTS